MLEKEEMKVEKRAKQKGKLKNKENLKLKGERAITLIALVITILFSYDEKLKFSNSKGFLLQTI